MQAFALHKVSYLDILWTAMLSFTSWQFVTSSSWQIWTRHHFHDHWFFGWWQRWQLTKQSSRFSRSERLKQNVHHKQLTGMMKGCLLTTTSAAAAAVFSDKLSHWLSRRCIEQPSNSHPKCCSANQKPCRNVVIRSAKVLSSQTKASQTKPQDNDYIKIIE